MSKTESTPTDIPTPTTNYLRHLAAVLDTTDRDTLAQTFAELADEALVLAADAPTADWFRFWGGLHESFHYESQKRIPAEPKQKKRRWFW